MGDEYKFPSSLGVVIMSVLNALQEEEYLNGRTAAYWHIMAVLNQHMVRNHNDQSARDWRMI